MMPDTDALLAFGAKDPVRLAEGEFWRLLTPMFIHIGIVHFLVNSYMLYVIGYQLERILGGRWFLLIYLASGIGGNVASAVFSVHMSAGASGALFGLLGAGLFLELSIGRRFKEVTGRKPPNRAYLMTVVLNLAFGFIVPFIDNSAHLGGLVTGTMLTFAMVKFRPNTLHVPRRSVGIVTIATWLVLMAVGGFIGTNKAFISSRLLRAGDLATDAEEQIMFYSQAIAILPESVDLRLKRARLLFFASEAKYAYYDLRVVVAAGGHEPELAKLAEELAGRGLMTESWQVRRMSEHAP